MKLKHNKLRNTGLLYELLVRQITTDTLNNKESKALDILKKYYSKTELGKEYKIYNVLSTTKNINETKSEFVISSALDLYRKLDKKSLQRQKYNLISEIKKNYNEEDFFKSKVDNYKTIASVYMLLEMEDSNSINLVESADYKFTILENMIQKPVIKEDDGLEEFSKMDIGTRNLVYKILLENFNTEYGDLNDKQRILLREYINNISTTDKLKTYINTEISLLKNNLSSYMLKEEDARKVKLEEISGFMTEIPANKNVSDNDIQNLLYYYELIQEYETIYKK